MRLSHTWLLSLPHIEELFIDSLLEIAFQTLTSLEDRDIGIELKGDRGK
jgi:hypothetical protein